MATASARRPVEPTRVETTGHAPTVRAAVCLSGRAPDPIAAEAARFLEAEERYARALDSAAFVCTCGMAFGPADGARYSFDEDHPENERNGELVPPVCSHCGTNKNVAEQVTLTEEPNSAAEESDVDSDDSLRDYVCYDNEEDPATALFLSSWQPSSKKVQAQPSRKRGRRAGAKNNKGVGKGTTEACGSKRASRSKAASKSEATCKSERAAAAAVVSSVSPVTLDPSVTFTGISELLLARFSNTRVNVGTVVDALRAMDLHGTWKVAEIQELQWSYVACHKRSCPMCDDGDPTHVKPSDPHIFREWSGPGSFISEFLAGVDVTLQNINAVKAVSFDYRSSLEGVGSFRSISFLPIMLSAVRPLRGDGEDSFRGCPEPPTGHFIERCPYGSACLLFRLLMSSECPARPSPTARGIQLCSALTQMKHRAVAILCTNPVATSMQLQMWRSFQSHAIDFHRPWVANSGVAGGLRVANKQYKYGFTVFEARC